MLRGHPNALDYVVNKLDYTFIDLPDLIDASEEEVEPEPVYTQSVYALEAASKPHVSQQQQHQQQLQQATEQSAAGIAGSHWQQLQQFNSMPQPAGQIHALRPVFGTLGASLAGALQQQQCCQHQEYGQYTANLTTPNGIFQQQPPQQQEQQQQQQRHGPQQQQQQSTQQVERQALPSSQQTLAAAASQSDIGSSMDEG